MSGPRRKDSGHLADAQEHLRVLQQLLVAEAPEEWPRIVAMRNILAHQYADLDQEILQNTVDNRLDDLIRLAAHLHAAAIAREEPVTG